MWLGILTISVVGALCTLTSYKMARKEDRSDSVTRFVGLVAVYASMGIYVMTLYMIGAERRPGLGLMVTYGIFVIALFVAHFIGGKRRMSAAQ